MWYGLKIGLERSDILKLPYAEMLDLIAIEQIKHEGAKLKKTTKQEQEEFFDLLKFK